MAKKKNVEKSPRQYTRRQISHIKKQKRRQNLIFYGGISIIAVVIIIVLAGLYIGEIRPYRQTVTKVYDREFSARYYIDASKYTMLFYPTIQQAMQYALASIQQSELVRRGAEALGIVVGDDEVKESLEASGIPVNEASIDLFRANLLRDRLEDEYFSLEISETADQVNIKAMFLESENQVSDIAQKVAAGDNFTALADNYSLQFYTKDVASDLRWHISEWLEHWLQSTVPFDYAFEAEPGTLSGPVYDENLEKDLGYWIVNVLEREEEDQAHLQVILVGSQQEADNVLQRFVEGEDFGELAKEVSQDEASREAGGDLGVVNMGSRTDAFDAYVFALDIRDVGIIGPFLDVDVKTTGGFWLINVIDKEADRPLEEEDTNFLINQAYEDWEVQIFQEASEEIDTSYLTMDKYEWITDRLTEETS